MQKRFILALIISTAILIGWTYLFPAKPTQPSNNSNTQQAANNSPTPLVQPEATPSQQQQTAQPEVSVSDNPAQRKIIIKSPLYEAELNTKGAVATSWVVKKNKSSGVPLSSAGGSRQNPLPLQLISQEGVQRGEAPLRVVTDNEDVNKVLASRNYKLNGASDDGSDFVVDLPSGVRRLEFTLHDDATHVDIVKTITFNADSYSALLEVKLTRDGQTIPQAKLTIGPSIGDQGITHYTFYSVAPEGIAVVDEKRASGLQAKTINENKQSPDHLAVNGEVGWAGVGDTYFAMLAVPSKKLSGLEYRTTKYEQDIADGKKEPRYLVTALVPIPTDGSVTSLYVGPKDVYLLNAASAEISGIVNRPVDLGQAIDYGWLSYLSRPLAAPILWSIKHLYQLTGSYGLAIIIFTIIIYSLFFPLKWQSSRKMKKAQKYAPRMKELQEKIKGMKQSDPRLKELQVEQLRLMKEANPLGGCLPLLIQMPFLFALYRAITISIDFRQATFLWIPELSAAEPTFIHILPLLMAGSMIVLQVITPAPSTDPMQRWMMAIMMPLLMLYMLWNAPAGLLVYWLVGNVVGFSQQFLINRMTKSEDDQGPPEKKPERANSKKLSAARAS